MRHLAITLMLAGGLYSSPANPGNRLDGEIPAALPNDNRSPAGRERNGRLEVTLTARTTKWFPDGDRRPAPLVVPAFAAEGAPLIPGPLIRVRAGTEVQIHVANRLTGAYAGKTIFVHGLQSRSSTKDEVIRVDPDIERPVTFTLRDPGTYYYWASFSDTTSIDSRTGPDSPLSGAIVVDPREGSVPNDRVFVISHFSIPPEGEGALHQPSRFVIAVNGLSWPRTEQIEATVRDTLRWRWVNPSDANHPMHLHGFYYTVNSVGDNLRDTIFAPAERKFVVTERMDPGGTMTMTWIPSRPGNWLFHCHVRAHSGPDGGWGFPDIPGTSEFGSELMDNYRRKRPAPIVAHDGMHDMNREMAGLITGIHVAPRAKMVSRAGKADRRRHNVRLTILPPEPGSATIRTQVQESRTYGKSAAHSTGIGPAIVLRRGEPALIDVVNRMDVPTAIHWHGIELESYFDGVPGWTGGRGGGMGNKLSPVIAPGGTFAALMTPPRAGTFIYHSHSLLTTQVGDGLYGPLIVLDRNEAYSPEQEIHWIVGGRDRAEDSTGFLLLNGSRSPDTLRLRVGQRYRVRIINITESNTADLALLDIRSADPTPESWRPLAKDGAALAPDKQKSVAAIIRASVGQTFDFEITPDKSARWRLEVRNGGNLMVRQDVLVR